MAEDVVFDTILSLPEATREYEQFVLDFSNPEHHQHLGTGWNLPQPGVIPFSKFLWSADSASFVHFPVRSLQPLELLINVRPFIFEGSPPITLTLEWNAIPIGKIKLSKDWDLYRLEIPVSSQQPGDNLLFIHQSQIFSPGDISKNSTDTRILGSAYAFMILRTRREPLPPGNQTISQVLGEKDLIFQGAAHQVICDEFPASFTYRVQLPSKPVLSFGAGIYPDSVVNTGPDARFSIRIKNANNSDWKELFRARLRPPRRMLEMGWRKYRRNLADYANQTVDVRFDTVQDPATSPGINLGSWLSPVILNKHVPMNLVFFPGSGSSWPPREMAAGSNLAALYAQSSELMMPDSSIFPTHPTTETESPVSEDIPIDPSIIDTFRREGWATGYFFCGRNPAIMEDTIADKFDALVGYSELNRETGDELVTESMNWAARLENRNFFLILDWNSAQYTNHMQDDLVTGVLSWLYSAQLERDTLIVTYNSEPNQPFWYSLPQNGMIAPPKQPVGNWNDFMMFLYNRLAIKPASLEQSDQ